MSFLSILQVGCHDCTNKKSRSIICLGTLEKCEFIILFSEIWCGREAFFPFFSYTFFNFYDRNHGGHHSSKHTDTIKFSKDVNKGCRSRFNSEYTLFVRKDFRPSSTLYTLFMRNHFIRNQGSRGQNFKKLKGWNGLT